MFKGDNYKSENATASDDTESKCQYSFHDNVIEMISIKQNPCLFCHQCLKCVLQ